MFLLFGMIHIYGISIAQTFDNELYQSAWKSLLHRIEMTVEQIAPGEFPMLADNRTGVWETSDEPKWTGGFWVGMLWLTYEKTGQPQYLNWAKQWTDAIIGYEEEDNHDRGFVYFYSSVSGYQLTGNLCYYKSGLQAAAKLVEMQNPATGMIPQHLSDPSNVIIDTMVNLPLLWWAHRTAPENDSLKSTYYEVALSQALKTQADFIRDDYSTWQSVHYDARTGELIKKHTHQGAADSTCWSRGQSWGLYGFIKAFLATGEMDFLRTAENLGSYIIDHLPEDGVPWYDYDDPDKKKDTSAGAIAASAFLQLSRIVEDKETREKYHYAGIRMLNALIENHLTPFGDGESPPGILRNGCYQIFNNADSETIWGDYYLMEALAEVLFPNQ